MTKYSSLLKDNKGTPHLSRKEEALRDLREQLRKIRSFSKVVSKAIVELEKDDKI